LQNIQQYPKNGEKILKYRGDIITFSVSIPEEWKGKLFLRTNLGHANTARNEIVCEVEKCMPCFHLDWFDLPMERQDDGWYRLDIPLLEVGHFEAKAFFLPTDGAEPVWSLGENATINVEPAEYCGGNIIYNAFVRQFGVNKSGKSSDKVLPKNIDKLDAQGYTVIPPSGTFRDLIAELDFIIYQLHTRIIQLLPVHPTPTVYGRMGRFGSPYAALDFTAIDPSLAEFDRKVTPLEQFCELVDAVHARNAKIMIDIAINHTGWAAKVHETAPQWLVYNQDGTIHSPGAWGNVWADLTELDHKNQELWEYLAQVFLVWCGRGVDGFRCDAGYMIPQKAWRFIVATVRKQYPNTIFLLEGLGGSVEVTRTLLDKENLNWAYSELFQNYTLKEITNYLPQSLKISESEGLMVQFAETHDNPRLAEKSVEYAKMRVALSALTAVNGAFAFTNGVEWLATEKIDVHEARSLNWGAEQNIVQYILRLNTLLMINPVFAKDTTIRTVQSNEDEALAILRVNKIANKKLLVLINLDYNSGRSIAWNNDYVNFDLDNMVDLLSGEKVIATVQKYGTTVDLIPGQVLAVSQDVAELTALELAVTTNSLEVETVQQQRYRALALEVYCYFNNGVMLIKNGVQALVEKLIDNPKQFCKSCNCKTGEPKVTTWNWQKDLHREVMLPPEHLLYIVSDTKFHYKIEKDGVTHRVGECDKQRDGRFFALVMPIVSEQVMEDFQLHMAIYKETNVCLHKVAKLVVLSDVPNLLVDTTVTYKQILKDDYLLLDTNARGGMMRANVSWGKLNSRYDALLAANLHPDYPVDRHIMLTRCRAWVLYQGYSTPLSHKYMLHFRQCADSSGEWLFKLPTGLGKSVLIQANIRMITNKNVVVLTFVRKETNENCYLASSIPIKLIIRPDVEDRSFHEVTKASLGPEQTWAGAVKKIENGFEFAPQQERCLHLETSKGEFFIENEWQYNVHRPLEDTRGLEAYSDLFSPGYFSINLKEKEKITLLAQILTKDDTQLYKQKNEMKKIVKQTNKLPMLEALKNSMQHYIVKRDDLKTVIAGYPWFLDWGRDTFICARGMIAAGMTDDVLKILQQFAKYEKNGTIPNMICGDDDGNRDTSDAPLWFFVVCADLIRKYGNNKFLKKQNGKRSLLNVLESIAEGYIIGSDNGVYMDAQSGLIFSPAHFTWMDTNYPASTPRQGYPIEIQALWYAALNLLDETSANSRWKKLKIMVKKSINKYFYLPDNEYYSDCLHANKGQSPEQAVADDALRCNQLFVLSLTNVADTKIAENVLAVCEELIVPGAIRTLADKPVKIPLPIKKDQQNLNDPYNPYWHNYLGDEDTRRKPAYHNGTAWAWVFPTFTEAWLKTYGKDSKKTVKAWLQSCHKMLHTGSISQLPEIVDADAPHAARGCDAQAWSVTEFYRVLRMVTDNDKQPILE